MNDTYTNTYQFSDKEIRQETAQLMDGARRAGQFTRDYTRNNIDDMEGYLNALDVQHREQVASGDHDGAVATMRRIYVYTRKYFIRVRCLSYMAG